MDRFLEQLVAAGLITRAQLEEARSASAEGGSLLSRLVRMGAIGEEEWVARLAEAFGLPAVDLGATAIDAAAATRMPAELARRHTLIPIALDGGRLTVALADPTNILALDDVKLTTGLELEPVLAGESAIRAAIEEAYPDDAMDDALADLRSEVVEDQVAPYSPQPLPPEDRVHFSVYAPTQVAAGQAFLLELWAYLAEQREEMRDRAARSDRLVERGSRGPVRVASDSDLDLVLRLDGFEVEEPHESLFWCGEITNASFAARALQGLGPGPHPGHIEVLQGGLRITRVCFDLFVADEASPRDQVIAHAQPVRSAFASYASRDRDEVLRRVQGISAAGIDVFLDALSLRAGDHWEQEILRNIRARDVFYLFWSRAARESEWVEREWRLALEERGVDYIHPVPLADPRQVPPPAELASRNFNDLILACIRAEGSA